MWNNNNGGNGQTAESGYYQGCGGTVASSKNSDWDVIERPGELTFCLNAHTCEEAIVG
jgi:hypothetical protein